MSTDDALLFTYSPFKLQIVESLDQLTEIMTWLLRVSAGEYCVSVAFYAADIDHAVAAAESRMVRRQAQ